jgi:F-type H+-transporting ATPase subunit epsilon
MADKRFLLEITTPERVVVSEEVEMVIIPGTQGEFQVYIGHTPFLTDLAVGLVSFDSGGKRSYICISGGFCEVTPTRTVIRARTAEPPGMIDKARAQAARDRAMQRLAAKDTVSIDEARARLALMRAINRISVADMK